MFITMESSAQMPSKVRAAYRKIAVVQLTQHAAANDIRPKQISERDRCILRVVRIFPNVPAAGKTERSGIVETRAAASALATELNTAKDWATAEQIIGAGGSA